MRSIEFLRTSFTYTGTPGTQAGTKNFFERTKKETKKWKTQQPTNTIARQDQEQEQE